MLVNDRDCAKSYSTQGGKDMRSQPRVWLVLIGVVVLAASVAACTSPSRTTRVALPTPTASPIQVTVDRTVYNATEPIGITVTNTTKTVFYATTGRSACTFLQ